MSHSLPYLLADRYQLTQRLGEGSFAETFLATDSLLQRQVAVKILREQYARDPHFATRFTREAQAAAAVSHPNVVEVYDSGHAGETLFIVMEWVEGPDLKQLIREQAPLPIPEAIRLLRELLQGLAAIHQAGIIHRDVKPQNVLLSKQGTAKLTDFGIARGAVGSSLTETGMALGTAAYMAPEQASGKPVGPGVDLYAAGVILFELVTGELPFPGANPVQVMYRQVHEPVPRPREVNRAIPAELEGVILRALAKEPGQRYPTAEAMAEALAGIGAAEATRVVTAVPADDTVEHRQSRQRAAHSSPPPAVGQALAPGRSSTLSWPAALLAGVLIVFGIGGIMLLGVRGFGPTGGSTPSPDPSPSLVAVETRPSPTPSPSPSPSPSPTPSPSPSPTLAPSPTEPSRLPGTELIAGRPLPFAWVKRFLGGTQAEPIEGPEFNGAYDPILLGPGGVPNRGLPRNAVFLFSRSSGFDTGTAKFLITERGGRFAMIEITAMSDNKKEKVPIEIRLNGALVWKGPSPFSSKDPDSYAWMLDDPWLLTDGINTLSISNTAPEGDAGESPWQLIHGATIYY